MRARIALRPRRPGLLSIKPVLRRGRGKANELFDEAAPLVDRSREAAASMAGVVDRGAAKRTRRRRGALAVVLLLVAAGVAVWLMWRRQDDEYARLVHEPDRPDLTPAPMPEPPQSPVVDRDPAPAWPARRAPAPDERVPITGAIPASALPPSMVEQVRSEFEAPEVAELEAADCRVEAAAPVAGLGRTDVPAIVAPSFTRPPLTAYTAPSFAAVTATEVEAPIEVEAALRAVAAGAAANEADNDVAVIDEPIVDEEPIEAAAPVTEEEPLPVDGPAQQAPRLIYTAPVAEVESAVESQPMAEVALAVPPEQTQDVIAAAELESTEAVTPIAELEPVAELETQVEPALAVEFESVAEVEPETEAAAAVEFESTAELDSRTEPAPAVEWEPAAEISGATDPEPVDGLQSIPGRERLDRAEVEDRLPAPLVSKPVSRFLTGASVFDAVSSSSLEEAVDEIVADIDEVESAIAELNVAAEDEPALPAADEGGATESAVSAFSDRLDQVSLASEPIEAIADSDSLEDVEDDENLEEAIEREAEAVTASLSADQPESPSDEETSEADEPAANGIPAWPGTAEAASPSTPLTASDAPAPPPPPTESERNGGRLNQPSRSGPPSSPGGAPFRRAGDQLPSQRSWPTLPR